MTGKEYLESIGITGDIQEVDTGHYQLIIEDSNKFDRINSIIEKHFDLAMYDMDQDGGVITYEYGNNDFNVDLDADFENDVYVLNIYEVK